MRLCDEYFLRVNSKKKYPIHVSKGFVFFDDYKLLSICWVGRGSSIGHYEIFESSLDQAFNFEKKCIQWNEYENFINNWSKDKKIILNKNEIFYFIWVFFLKKYEIEFVEKYDPFKIYLSLNKNSTWKVGVFDLLKHIEKDFPDIFNFWKNRLDNIMSNYCDWISSG